MSFRGLVCRNIKVFFVLINLNFASDFFIRSNSAISKIGNGESRNGERGTGNGERGISKIGNI